VDASRSTERPPGPLRALLSLGRYERLAALGALACIASVPLPWYHVRYADSFTKSGFGSFGFAEAALLITVAAALVLLVEVGRGRRPPLPLHVGTMLIVAGVWSAILVGLLMIDRPTTTIRDFPTDYALSFGIFVAMAGAVTIAVAGWRIRHSELSREAAARLTPGEEAARSPTSASRTRSPR
jgi:hypothetical protein